MELKMNDFKIGDIVVIKDIISNRFWNKDKNNIFWNRHLNKMAIIYNIRYHDMYYLNDMMGNPITHGFCWIKRELKLYQKGMDVKTNFNDDEFMV